MARRSRSGQHPAFQEELLAAVRAGNARQHGDEALRDCPWSQVYVAVNQVTIGGVRLERNEKFALEVGLTGGQFRRRISQARPARHRAPDRPAPLTAGLSRGQRGDRHRAADRRAVPGADAIRSWPPTADSRSAMPCRPMPCAADAGSNPAPSSVTQNSSLPSTCARRDGGERGLCVLRDVLQGLEYAEVQRRLGVSREPADPVGVDVHRHRRAVGLCLQGCAQPWSASTGG